MQTVLRQRAAKAEAGQWQDLLEVYLAELDGNDKERRMRPAEAKGPVADRLDCLSAAVEKARGGCLRAACQLLRGDARVPGTDQTFEELRQLTALPTTQAEVNAMAAALREARNLGDFVPNVRVRTVRRKLRTLKPGAEPGPSGWRNTTLIMLGARPGELKPSQGGAACTREEASTSTRPPCSAQFAWCLWIKEEARYGL